MSINSKTQEDSARGANDKVSKKSKNEPDEVEFDFEGANVLRSSSEMGFLDQKVITFAMISPKPKLSIDIAAQVAYSRHLGRLDSLVQNSTQQSRRIKERASIEFSKVLGRPISPSTPMDIE